MVKAIGDFPIKSLIESGEAFDRYLKARKPPMEDVNIKMKMREIEDLVLSDPAKYKLPKLSTDEADEAAEKLFESRKKQKVKEIFKQRVYSWQAINYDEHKALVYLIGRSAQEFGVLTRIFREIQRRDPTFTPRSFFDFGAGVGTGTWAAAELWKESIFEYYLVDASRCMNDLADLLLRDGDVNKSLSLRNVYHRQFLPARDDKFDLVLSAYSLFELPSLVKRLEVVNNLWNKAGKYLVLVENGTNAGFQVLTEVRDFLLHVKATNNEDAFVFSPCPHESPCPRFTLDDGTPCNFEVAYNSLPFSGTSLLMKDQFSYLVLRKGKPNEESDRWPRIIRPTLLRHKHAICRMCTPDGNIREGIFTAAKHGKMAFRCAKYSKWGDQLPIKILESEEEIPAEEAMEEETKETKET